MAVLRFLFRLLRGAWRWFRRLVALLILVLVLQYSTPPLGEDWMAITLLASGQQFDYIGWELRALATKTAQTFWGIQPFMEEGERTAFVRQYMADLATAQGLENQVQLIYGDPAVADPVLATADLRAQRDRLRDDLERRQPLAEAILEGQVAAVLIEQGFGVGGQLLPPISMHFTQMPNVMVISPRDTIRFEMSINLNPMPVDEQAALEDRIDAERNVSTLIAPLGGIALFPAMILETSSIQYALQTFAHEWVHHYLFMFPLGLNYDFASETRIINETTAELFGIEVGRLVLERYYPDLVPPPPPEPSTITGDDIDADATPTPEPTPDPRAFDFGRELNETRVMVDKLLAQGRITEAETYMEKRRQYFLANGYFIRKLNQAWFAFYGGYQVGTPGVAGDDPIGPSIQTLRSASPSLHAWVTTMTGITTRQQLVAAAEAAAVTQSPTPPP